MSKKSKIQAPKISKILDETIDVIDDMYDEELIEDKLIQNTLIEGIIDCRVRLNSCVFKNVIFESCDFRKIDFYPFFFGGDLLKDSSWSRAILGTEEEKKNQIASFELALKVANKLME